MDTRLSIPDIKNKYNALPDRLKAQFKGSRQLINAMDSSKSSLLDVCIAYLFVEIEKVHNRALYAGLTKKHKVHRDVAQKAVDKQRLTHDAYHQFYEKILGKHPSQDAKNALQKAQSIRNKILHGKKVTDHEKKQAIMSAFDYAELAHEEMKHHGQFSSFGDMRGFRGPKRALDQTTSVWVVKGMGFTATPAP